VNLRCPDPAAESTLRLLAGQALSRAGGAPLVPGNAARILEDAGKHYPAWLSAIGTAQHTVTLENYIFADDDVGREFVAALAAKAREGVRVRAIYDWLGSFSTRRRLWPLLDAGGEVRGFNPPRLASPLGWLTRDHRKMLAVDGRIGFVTGLCVSRKWLGDPAKGIAPWRDTGIEVRGPGVADGRWARIGSTNLNIASWLGNYELDVVIEDRRFARAMEEMYEEDLANATEIVLDARRRVCSTGAPAPRACRRQHGPCSGRGAAYRQHGGRRDCRPPRARTGGGGHHDGRGPRAAGSRAHRHPLAACDRAAARLGGRLGRRFAAGSCARAARRRQAAILTGPLKLPDTAAYWQPVAQVLAELGTDAHRRLSEAEARARLERHGRNELAAEKPLPAWRKFLAQFQDALVILLLVTTLISAGLWLLERDSALPYEAIAILAVVALNALMGYISCVRTARACTAILELPSAYPVSGMVRQGFFAT